MLRKAFKENVRYTVQRSNQRRQMTGNAFNERARTMTMAKKRLNKAIEKNKQPEKQNEEELKTLNGFGSL